MLLLLYPLSHLIFASVLNHGWITVLDNFIGIPNYNLFRHDRNKQGGGICVWVHSSYRPQLLKINPPAGINAIWIILPSIKFVIAGCYVPPVISIQLNNEIIDFIVNTSDRILNQYDSYSIMVGGVLNQLDTASKHLCAS